MTYQSIEYVFNITGLIISVLLYWLFGYIIEKFKIGFPKILDELPVWTGYIFILIILLCVPILSFTLAWGYYFYIYIIEGKTLNALLVCCLNILGVFVTSYIWGNFTKNVR